MRYLYFQTNDHSFIHS